VPQATVYLHKLSEDDILFNLHSDSCCFASSMSVFRLDKQQNVQKENMLTEQTPLNIHGVD